MQRRLTSSATPGGGACHPCWDRIGPSSSAPFAVPFARDHDELAKCGRARCNPRRCRARKTKKGPSFPPSRPPSCAASRLVPLIVGWEHCVIKNIFVVRRTIPRTKKPPLGLAQRRLYAVTLAGMIAPPAIDRQLIGRKLRNGAPLQQPETKRSRHLLPQTLPEFTSSRGE